MKTCHEHLKKQTIIIVSLIGEKKIGTGTKTPELDFMKSHRRCAIYDKPSCVSNIPVPPCWVDQPTVRPTS